MIILAFDTAGPACQAAVARCSDAAGEPEAIEILAERSEPLPRGHAERLLPMIAEVLAEAGVGYPAIGRIVVTTGPGSFTGVRIGVAAARGLALALGRPAVGVGTLDALLRAIVRGASGTQGGTAAAVLDARRGEVFAAACDVRTGRSVVPAGATTLQALALELRSAAPPLILIGSGAALLAAEPGHAGPVVVAGESAAPEMADVLALGGDAPPAPPAPLYLRDPDARPQTSMAAMSPPACATA